LYGDGKEKPLFEKIIQPEYRKRYAIQKILFFFFPTEGQSYLSLASKIQFPYDNLKNKSLKVRSICQQKQTKKAFVYAALVGQTHMNHSLTAVNGWRNLNENNNEY